jgi:hypothetical protein
MTTFLAATILGVTAENEKSDGEYGGFIGFRGGHLCKIACVT